MTFSWLSLSSLLNLIKVPIFKITAAGRQQFLRSIHYGYTVNCSEPSVIFCKKYRDWLVWFGFINRQSSNPIIHNPSSTSEMTSSAYTKTETFNVKYFI